MHSVKIFLSQGVYQVKDMFRFFDIVEIEGANQNATVKITLDGKEGSEIRNDTNTEYASAEDPLKMRGPALNETTLASEYEMQLMGKMLLLHQGNTTFDIKR